MLDTLATARRPSNGLALSVETLPAKRIHANRVFTATPIFALALGTLLPLNTLTNVGDELSWIGRLSIAFTMSLPSLLLFGQLGARKGKSRSWLGFIACFSVLFLLYLPRGGDGDRDWVPLLQIALVAVFFGGCASCAWPYRSLKVLGWIAQFWLCVSLLTWIWYKYPIPFTAWYENSNANGAILAYVSGLAVFALPMGNTVNKKFTATGWLCAVTVLIATAMSRAAIMAVLLGTAIYIAWPAIVRTRTRHIATLVLLLGSVGGFFAMQTILASDMYDRGYNDLSHELTGKNLGTRTKVWKAAGELILERPLFGHGAETQISNMLGMDISSHSLYLQVILQVGFVGLATLLALFFVIWNTFWQGRRDPIVRLTGAFFCGMLLHQAFAVSLTQNNLALGVIAWLVLAIGVSRSLAIKDHSAKSTRRRPSRSRSSNLHPLLVRQHSVA